MHTFCVAALTKIIIHTYSTSLSYRMIVDATSIAAVSELLTLIEGRDKESRETIHNWEKS